MMQESLKGTDMNPKPLPEFDPPPVNEVVFGMLTQPVAGLAIPHFGRFWERVKDTYPKCQEAPPILPLVETFGDQAATMNLELSDVPLPRVWLVSESENYLIQLQRDRFHCNWRRVRPDDTYPRYPAVRDRFEAALDSFRMFLTEFDLPVAKPLQFELSYINHIPINAEFPLADEIKRILRDYAWESEGRFLGEADQFSSSLAFLMPESLGRLHTVARLGQHRETRERILSLELVARGLPASFETSEMWSWFDLAHEWIVRGFCDLTEEAIQRDEWRRVR
jgi:uncharacterized protein (TIGR04255 family)